MIHKLLKRPQAIIGLCLIAIVIVIAIAAPAFSPHDPELVNLSQKYAQPDAEYPLGTDQLGRCTLSRLLYGARYSIGISLPVLLILSVIGLIVGTFSACAGEKADHFITIDIVELNHISCSMCYVNNSIYADVVPEIGECQRQLMMGAEFCYDAIANPKNYDMLRISNKSYTYTSLYFG